MGALCVEHDVTPRRTLVCHGASLAQHYLCLRKPAARHCSSMVRPSHCAELLKHRGQHRSGTGRQCAGCAEAGRRAAQDNNSWTPNGTAIAILGQFFRSGELVRDFWSKALRAWVRAAPAGHTG